MSTPVLPRTKHVPKHRAEQDAPVFGQRLRRTVTSSGVAAAAIGLAVSGGLTGQDQSQVDAPAQAAETTVAAITVVPDKARVVREETGDRSDRASRSERRTSLAPASKEQRENETRRKGQRAEPEDNTPDPVPTDPRAIAREMLPEFGFSPAEFGCLDALYVSESDWDMHADNPTSSAYGIPQALMSAHQLPADYTTNAATQIRWGLGYIRDSYGTPCVAWEFKQANAYY